MILSINGSKSISPLLNIIYIFLVPAQFLPLNSGQEKAGAENTLAIDYHLMSPIFLKAYKIKSVLSVLRKWFLLFYPA
jgi:hypothetical protein